MFHISTIIPVYNGERFIERAVESVLQHKEVKEIILIDDGSTDTSLEICQNLVSQDKRIVLYTHKNKANKGAGATRNLGIKKAKNPYISFLDVDDIYLENRFIKDAEIFKTHPDAEGTINALGMQVIDEEARADFDKIEGIKALTTYSESVSPEEIPYVFYGLHPRVKGSFSIVGLTLKKAVIERIGYIKNHEMHEDTEWFFRMVVQVRLYCSEMRRPTGLRGIHSRNRVFIGTNAASREELYRSAISSTRDLPISPLFKLRLKLLLPYKIMTMRKKVTLKDMWSFMLVGLPYLFYYMKYRVKYAMN